MIERIILCFCSLLCAFPFYIFPMIGKDSREPMSFWTGDTSLKGKVRDIKAYNLAMSKLYKTYGSVFLAAAVGGAVYPLAGLVILLLNSTLGIYIVYRKYKSILAQYS